MKNKILKNLSNWHDSDFELLMRAIENSKLAIPYSLGESEQLTKFKEIIKSI